MVGRERGAIHRFLHGVVLEVHLAGLAHDVLPLLLQLLQRVQQSISLRHDLGDKEDWFTLSPFLLLSLLLSLTPSRSLSAVPASRQPAGLSLPSVAVVAVTTHSAHW